MNDHTAYHCYRDTLASSINEHVNQIAPTTHPLPKLSCYLLCIRLIINTFIAMAATRRGWIL